MKARSVGVLAVTGGAFLFLGQERAAGETQPSTTKDAAAAAPSRPLRGTGTPGFVPVWDRSGRRFKDSNIMSNPGSTFIDGSLDVWGYGVRVYAQNGFNGVEGVSVGGHGVFGQAQTGENQSGVHGEGRRGVTGYGWGADGRGVLGFAVGADAVAVEGRGGAVAVRGETLQCDDTTCTPGVGDAGQFVAGAGGNLLHGFLAHSLEDRVETFRVDAAGNGFYQGDLTVAGNAYKPGGGSWSTLSDARVKKAIRPIDHALRQLLQLRGVTFEYADPAAVHERTGAHLGMVAQEVEQTVPSWVDGGPDGYKRVTFRGFEALAVEAVRELDTEVSARSQEAMARIEELERQNAALRDALAELTARVRTLPPE